MTIVFAMLITFFLVVTLHELGHYLAARAVSVRADVFSVGFGPSICAVMDRRGTRWQIAMLPVGGYCRFVGDENVASLKTGRARDIPDGALDAAPILHRAFVVAAGPAINLALAFVLFALAALLDPEPHTLANALARASDQLFGFLALIVGGLSKLIVGLGDFCDLSGPVGIASMSASTFALGPHIFFQFMAVVSGGLAVLNLLPIPGLDGGHLLSYMIEAVTGRPPPPIIDKVLSIAGFTLIIFLMLMATLADLLC